MLDKRQFEEVGAKAQKTTKVLCSCRSLRTPQNSDIFTKVPCTAKCTEGNPKLELCQVELFHGL